MTAETAANTAPHARRAIILGAANALRSARPTSATVEAAIDRLMRRVEAIGDLSEDGRAIADALRAEADAIVAEATEDHGRLASMAVDALSWPADGRPLRVLTLGATGPLASGQFGTALGVIGVAHHRGRPIHVWVCETRPSLVGARVTAWELSEAGVAHALIADAAAGHLMVKREVDVVLVGAERISVNGDVAAEIGTATLAMLASLHQVPFYVATPLATYDPAIEGAWALELEDGTEDEVLSVRGRPIAPSGTRARNPALDITTEDLVTGFLTEEGLIEQPYFYRLGEAVSEREARWAAARWTAPEPVGPAEPPMAPLPAEPAVAGEAGEPEPSVDASMARGAPG